MKAKIALITILTDNVPVMVDFYTKVLGFEIAGDHGENVEFHSEGVRFAICSRSILSSITNDHAGFKEERRGQSFELAFPLETREEVDRMYDEIIAKGAAPVASPADMPWGQRTAFFADPDGNIHELFAE
ncbi:VOC family protein [Marinicrinis lubricantis]|uniref:VOC family protein n=1 Tax=Marinicrinis lubricantis TaxID=2086470 RepID=A0ABW1IPG2_9BACL